MRLVDSGCVGAEDVHDVTASWVEQLAPWDTIGHFTFRWEASIWSAERCVRKFMRRELRGASYFAALERNPSRDGYHCHMLLAGCRSKNRKLQIWSPWFERYGRALVEPIRDGPAEIAGYCAKYVTKEDSWWWPEIQWHHRECGKEVRLAA